MRGRDVDDTLFEYTGSDRSGALRHLEAERLLERHASPEAALARWREVVDEQFARFLSGELGFHEQRRERARGFLGTPLTDDEAEGWFARYVALGLPPAEVAYVGDRHDIDARAADEAGLHGVWIDRGGAPVPAAAATVRRVTGLAQLPRLLSGLLGGRNRPERAPDGLNRVVFVSDSRKAN